MSRALGSLAAFARSRAAPLYFLSAAAALAVAAVAGVALGSTEIGWESVLRTVFSKFLPEGWIDLGGVSEAEQVIIWQIRMPRVIVGGLAGCGLAVAGMQVQAVFRNPLAEPSVIGSSQGAALGAVTAFVTELATRSALWLPLFAFSGALIALFTVYAVASRAGRTPVATLLLAGIALGSLISAATSMLISLNFVNWQVASEIVFWMMGGLDGRTWTHVWISAPLIAVGASVAFWFVRDLDLMLLGEEASASLGVEVERVKRSVLTTAALLTGTAVAVSGVIGFVGLVVPHVIRILLGPAHRALLPASILTGAAFLIGCDILARTVYAPTELRLGVVTALFGAPLFLYLLRRKRLEVAVL